MSKRTLDLQEVAAAIGGTYVGAKVEAKSKKPNISTATLSKLKKLGFELQPQPFKRYTRFATLGDVNSKIYALAMYDGDADFYCLVKVLGMTYNVDVVGTEKAKHMTLGSIAKIVNSISTDVSELVELQG
jgi:hypothetical protein